MKTKPLKDAVKASEGITPYPDHPVRFYRLDDMIDVVLRYKPPATTKAKKKRQRKARKAAKSQS